jgi:uncharacterized protein (TIGR01777 family)
MRVLVTGASGMIGTAVCDALLARGDEAVGLSRDPERASRMNPKVAWHAWQPASERPPDEALAGLDGAINLIGEEINQRLTPEAKRRISESRERATKNLVDGLVAAAPRPRVLVSQSAVGYYGDAGEAIVDESAPPGTDFLAQLVQRWEDAARPAEEAGIRLVILRSAPVLDRSGGLLRQILLPFRLGLGGPIASGRQYMAWIHRDDEVGLILWALDTDSVSGVFNATAPNPVTNREFSKALGRALRRPAIVPVPKAAVAALRGGELADAVTSSLRTVPRRALDAGYRFRHTEVEPALRAALRD